MRRLTILILLIMTSGVLFASSPKVVIREVLKAEKAADVNSRNKCNFDAKNAMDKIPAKRQDELYLLAKSLYLTQVEGGEKIIDGYRIFCENYHGILHHIDLNDLMKDCATSFNALKNRIERASENYMRSIGTPQAYSDYLSLAREADHFSLETIEYEYVKLCNSKGVCDNFLTRYNSSQYRADVEKILCDILYDEAMASTNESVISAFIVEHSDHSNIEALKDRLRDLKYERMMKSASIAEMKQFVADYPSFKGNDVLKQRMADMEYATLENSAESLRAFLIYYPNVKQAADVARRLSIYDIVDSGDVKMIVDYVKSHGYDKNYSLFMRSLYKSKGYYILTPDLREVTHIRYINKQGKVGYMDLEGNVVIEPKYDAYAQSRIFVEDYDNVMSKEFIAERPYAAVYKDGKWGVINIKGEYVKNHIFVDVSLEADNIVGCIETGLEGGSTRWFRVNYYNYTGEMTAHNIEIYTSRKLFKYAAGVDKSKLPLEKDVKLLTDKYGYVAKMGKIVDTNGGSSYVSEKLTMGVSDNVAIGTIKENGVLKRYFINLEKADTKARIKECSYEEVGTLSCGRIAVKFNGMVGFLNENLEEVIPMKYKCGATLPRFSCGVAAVQAEDGSYMLIDTDGKPISDARYGVLRLVSSGDRCAIPGIFIEQQGKQYDTKYRLVDACGEVVTPWMNKNPMVVDNCAIIDNARSTSGRYVFYEVSAPTITK